MIACSRRSGVKTRRNVMKSLMNKEGREIEVKTSGRLNLSVDEYRKRISDDNYLDHAIKKIASDLSHYLTK